MSVRVYDHSKTREENAVLNGEFVRACDYTLPSRRDLDAIVAKRDRLAAALREFPGVGDTEMEAENKRLVEELAKIRSDASLFCGDNECLIKATGAETKDGALEAIAGLRQRAERAEAILHKAACVLGSPKDAERLDEALGYVLASYRARGERAETILRDLRAWLFSPGNEYRTPDEVLTWLDEREGRT
jgi:hypothetical protein